MFLLYKRTDNLYLPVDLILKLFDHTIAPILLFSAEIWGYKDSTIIERIHTQFLRKIANLRQSTPLYMLYAEFGRYPLNISIKTRMVNFWNRLITEKQTKLAYQIYKYMLNLPNFNSKWINYIKNIFIEIGMFDIWQNQQNIQCKTLKILVKQTLIDQNNQHWHSQLQNSSRGLNYSIYKDSIKLEAYLLKLSKAEWVHMLKFRTGNHFFPNETGRWA